MLRSHRLAVSLALLATVAGCANTVKQRTPSASQSAPPPSSAAPVPTNLTARATPPASPASTGVASDDGLVGQVLRFAGDDVTIEVTLDADHPASRNLVDRLPLTLSFEEFAGREKIGYLPEELDTDDSPGSEPSDGDLIYYKPWGNLGFYYNAPRGVDPNVIQIGRFDASPAELDRLTRGPVTVTMLDRR